MNYEKLREDAGRIGMDEAAKRAMTARLLAAEGKPKRAPVRRVLPAQVRARVAMEAGCTMPWYKYTGLDGEVLGIDHYGASAPAAKLFEAFGFTADNVVAAAERVLKK